VKAKSTIALFAFAALIASLPAPAGNYPLGTLTCDDIGQYAKELVTGIDAKKPKEVALQELDARSFKDPVEKKTLTDVLNVMYDGFGQSLYPDTAYGVMKFDCEKGRPGSQER
jgi:hypothetical protein